MNRNISTNPENALLSSRFNAHLTFNVLNTVQGLILENNNEKAFEFIGHYSRLLRRMLIHDSFQTPLLEELDIIQDYLALEQVRMENNFQYSIKVPKKLNSQTVPKSMLVGLVENAIKHGIKPLLTDGYIKIDCPSVRNQIIRVRNNAPILAPNCGLGCGLGISKEILNRFNQQTGSFVQMTLQTRNRRSKDEIEFETLINLSA